MMKPVMKVLNQNDINSLKEDATRITKQYSREMQVSGRSKTLKQKGTKSPTKSISYFREELMSQDDQI